MITALKDVLTDASITFTDKGMKIINFDKTHTILVNVLLHANKFEHYRCDPDKILVCANTLHLFKLISTMSNDDTLSIYIDISISSTLNRATCDVSVTRSNVVYAGVFFFHNCSSRNEIGFPS